jgi:hypothetical protein
VALARGRDDLGQHRRRRKHLVDLAALDHRQHDRGVCSVKQADRCAMIQVGIGHQRGAVGERRHQQQPALGARGDGQRRAKQQVGEPPPALVIDDALGETGGPRGEQDLAPCFKRHAREAAGFQGRLPDFLDTMHDHIQRAEQLGLGRTRDHVPCLAEREAMLPVRCTEARVQGRLRRAGEGHAVARPDGRNAVAQQRRDRLAGPDAGREQAIRE